MFKNLQINRESDEFSRKSKDDTKLFLNMVIHDLRNPTQQINFAIKYALEGFKNAMQQVSIIERAYKLEQTQLKTDIHKFCQHLNKKLIELTEDRDSK